MFNDTKYTKWYYNIIKVARARILDGYTEKHHIVPKCLGGSNHKYNIVPLTAREHFICHWLLTKMVSETKHTYQMWNAFSCMLYRKNEHQQRYKINSKTFNNIKEQGSKIKSKVMSGEGNPMYGRTGILSPAFGKKQTPEHIEKLRQTKIGKIRSIESRQKQSSNTKGKKQTPEHIEKRKRSGSVNGMFGKKHSAESIAKRTTTLKANKLKKKLENPKPIKIKGNANKTMLENGNHPSSIKKTCDHCNITVSVGMFGRWHKNCSVRLEARNS